MVSTLNCRHDHVDNIFVLCAPMCVVSLSIVFPAILVPPLSLNVTFMENSIFLSCQASGFPVPTISWLHNGTDISITADPRLSIVTQERERSILSILEVNALNVNVNDSGEYVCSASSSITEFLDVLSDPVIVLVRGVCICMHVGVCMRVCVRACVRPCMCVCVHLSHSHQYRILFYHLYNIIIRCS